jgi:hypothetical protein
MALQLGLLGIHLSSICLTIHSRFPLSCLSSNSCLLTEACPLGTLVHTKLPSGCVTWLSHPCLHITCIDPCHALPESKLDKRPVEMLQLVCMTHPDSYLCYYSVYRGGCVCPIPTSLYFVSLLFYQAPLTSLSYSVQLGC